MLHVSIPLLLLPMNTSDGNSFHQIQGASPGSIRELRVVSAIASPPIAAFLLSLALRTTERQFGSAQTGEIANRIGFYQAFTQSSATVRIRLGSFSTDLAGLVSRSMSGSPQQRTSSIYEYTP
jgi:hypothetical protein